MVVMRPVTFETFMATHGKLQKYSSGRIFHTQDFSGRLFLLKSGYVKRYQAQNLNHRVLELIYGPGHIISLSQLYKMLFGINQNQDDFLYVYETMTEVELFSIDADAVIEELHKNPAMYEDFFYESGLKLRSNIFRLTSNSIKDEDKKIAHQLASLAYEFCGVGTDDLPNSIKLPFPHTAKDLSEQLNIPENVVSAGLKDLEQKHIIKVDGSTITILDMQFLKEMYL